MSTLPKEAVKQRRALSKATDTLDLEQIQTLYATVDPELQKQKPNYFLGPVLTAALEQKNKTVVDWTLSQGVTQNSILDPVSHTAVLTRDISFLKALIDAGADLNGHGFGADAYDDDANGVLAAIHTDQMDMLEYLIEAGAELNFVSKKGGHTPLELAETLGKTDMVTRLKAAGATGASEDQLELFQAAKREKWERVKVLLPETSERDLHKVLEPLCTVPNWPVLETLLPVLDDKAHIFLLGMLAREGHLAEVGQLLKQGVDINGLPGHPNPYWPEGWGDTALVLASQRNKVDMVAFLLAQGADPNLTDKRKDTALHEAAKRNHVAIAELLLNAGADHKIKNDQKETPLKKAQSYWGKDVVPLLKKAGAKPRTATGIARSTRKKLKAHERLTYRPKVKTGAQGTSFYGGAPHGEGPWPNCGVCKHPLAFFMQLNLCELPESPGEGLAQLFYCTGCNAYQDERTWLARWVPDTDAKLAPPDTLTLFPQVPITGWSKGKADLPLREYDIWEQVDLDADEQEKATEYNASGDKSGGWPHWIQDPQWPTDSQGKPMHLLMQLDPGHVPHTWGDSGLAFWFYSPGTQEFGFCWQSH